MLSLDQLAESAPKPTDDLVKNGRYVIPDPTTGVTRRWTRASGFGKTITDNYMLGLWKERNVALGLVARPDLYDMVSVAKTKEEINSICTKAKEAAGASKGANTGTFIHTVTEEIDRGNLPKVRPEVMEDVTAYVRRMKELGLRPIPEYIERVIVCPRVDCAGRYDRVLEVGPSGLAFTHITKGKVTIPPGTLLIGDVKTGQNIGYAWLEVVIQLAIYANATHIYNPGPQTFEEMPNVSKEWAIVMSIPAGSKTCELYWLDIEAGWELAQLAKQVRIARNRKSLAGLLTVANPIIEKTPGTGVDWQARIDEAKTRADLSRVWEEAEALGQWTDELTAYGLERKEELRG